MAAFAIAVLCLAGVVSAAPTDDLAPSPVAVRVLDFIQAFNSGEEMALRDWIAVNYTDSVLRLSPADRRMENFRRVKQDLYHITLQQVLAIDDMQTSTLMRTARDEWYRIDFVHETAAPYRLHGLMVDRTAAPALAAAAGAALSERAAIDSTRRLLTDLWNRDEFSGVVLVARGDRPVVRAAQGYEDRERRSRMRADTRFNVGTIATTFTRVAVERLIAAGRISRDTRLGELLPDYPNAVARESVTVGHLLDHTSGVPDFVGDEFQRAPKDSIRELRDYLPFFAAKPTHFAPGSREQYSSSGYILLGLIIEQLTGQNFRDHIRDHVFAPLRMRDSGWWTPEDRVRHRAVGYTRRTGNPAQQAAVWQPNTGLLPPRGSSAGGAYSTVEDLLQFVNALGQGRLTAGRDSAVHLAGGAPGLNAVVESGVGGLYTVIVLSNYDPPAAEEAARRIVRWFSRVKT